MIKRLSSLQKKDADSGVSVKKVQRAAITGVIVLGLGFAGWRVYQNIQKNKTEAKAAEDPNVRHAMEIRVAINPSGFKWMKSFDTTDETELFKIADKITDLNKVAKAYKKLYNSSMYSDLQSELDSKDYQKFMLLASKNNNNASQSPIHSSDDVQFQKWCLTKSDVNIRTDPVKKGTHTWQIGDNIITKLSSGKVIGLSTGKQIYDAVNDVVFTEIKATKKNKTTFNIYAWKGAIEFLSKEELHVRFGKNIPLEILDD